MELISLLPEIEAAAVRGWPALETAEIEGWLWRYSAGGSTRANSVATLMFNGTDVDGAIDAVEARARVHGVAACIALSDVSMPPDLDARLAARGYAKGEPNLTMAKWVDAGASMPAGVGLSDAPSESWIEAYMSGLTENRRSKARAILARLPSSAVFLSVEMADAAGGGRVTTSGLTVGDGAVASVQCMATLPGAQRQGGARRVLEGIEFIAARAGRRALYLQTPVSNVVAQALYRGVGYCDIGRYHTRTLPR